jgi:hypothetical protein
VKIPKHIVRMKFGKQLGGRNLGCGHFSVECNSSFITCHCQIALLFQFPVQKLPTFLFALVLWFLNWFPDYLHWCSQIDYQRLVLCRSRFCCGMIITADYNTQKSSESQASIKVYLWCLKMFLYKTLGPSYYCLYSLFNKIRDKGKIVSAG